MMKIDWKRMCKLLLHCHNAYKSGERSETIDQLGGMSWESTIPYYRLINEGIKQQLGGLHSRAYCCIA